MPCELVCLLPVPLMGFKSSLPIVPKCFRFGGLNKQPSNQYMNRNHNRKLEISAVPTKVKCREPAYSQVLVKIDRQRVRSRESQAGRQTVRRLWWMVFGVEMNKKCVV